MMPLVNTVYSTRFMTVILMVLLSAFSSVSMAQTTSLSSIFDDEPQFLKVEEAFIMDFSQQNNELVVNWTIADGYYLYQKQFKTVTKGATIGEPLYSPAPTQIEDEFFGISNVFFNQVDVTYPIIQSVNDGVVKIRFQGCAEAGLCYPPTTKVLYLSEVIGDGKSNSSSSRTLADNSDNDNTVSPSTTPATVSEQYRLLDILLEEGNLSYKLVLFLLVGIALAFTPCVFPMYPILSGLVIGQGNNISMSRAFIMSFVFVQGMAITYSILGLVVASAGVQFQAALQSPLLLSIFIILFIVLAIALFGGFEIQLPSAWQAKLNGIANQQKSGNLVGVFIMGIISGLVASPCTTAPLTGILLFIAQSGDLVLGFSALYALSLGMGIPLILFGMTGGKLLPKAGSWMNVVKVTFGFMMLTVAILFVERIIIHPYTDLLWAGVGFALFIYYFTLNQNTTTSVWKGIRNAVIIAGILSAFAYAHQAVQTVHPNVDTNSTSAAQSQQADTGHPAFLVVKDLGDLAAKIERANVAGKSVMVDLYADWCVACKEFEKYVFPDADVIDALSNTVWLQIDMTDNTPTNLAFQETFDVTGLPTILFFDVTGNELTQSRITGMLPPSEFATHVNTIFSSPSD
ncbi:MAG: Thiol:disulfide interchange protein DsbD [Glaciecola sp. HTCC2999]|jgi:thiol:disulfide interchange protein DsbD|nr:MAG: Thiol:disulfide interchange protein DsbD [Glaciecola sp. HTCC2999]